MKLRRNPRLILAQIGSIEFDGAALPVVPRCAEPGRLVKLAKCLGSL